MTDIVIAELQKNARETVRIAIREFKGSKNVDLRTYVENGEKELVPTNKGISIRPMLLRPVIEALQAAERAAVAEGLLP